MPRLTVSPALRPRSTFGRMPAATTTRSASILLPSLNSTPVTARPPRSACVRRPSITRTPSASILSLRYVPPAESRWRSIRVSIRCTTATSHPWTCRPRAASSPRRPPPMTTAFTPAPARPRRARVSSRVRNTKTPSLSSPGMDGIHPELPVATSSTPNILVPPPSSALGRLPPCRCRRRPASSSRRLAGVRLGSRARRRPFEPDRALLVIRLARDRIERALRHLVRVEFRPVEGHEDLSGCDGFGETDPQVADPAALRDHIDAIGGLHVDVPRVARIDLDPCGRRQPVENWHAPRLRARVPVLDGAARVQDQGKAGSGLLLEGLPFGGIQPRLASL